MKKNTHISTNIAATSSSNRKDIWLYDMPYGVNWQRHQKYTASVHSKSGFDKVYKLQLSLDPEA